MVLEASLRTVGMVLEASLRPSVLVARKKFATRNYIMSCRFWFRATLID